MAFGKSNKKTYTTTKTTYNGESKAKSSVRNYFWIISVLLLLQTIILLILAATAGKHNIWPFNRIWLAEAKVNMDRQSSVLSVGNKFSDLVNTVLPASFPNIAIPIEKLLVSQNSMKLFASKDRNALANAGVPENQWDNVQDMFVKFNKEESYKITPIKDGKEVDIGPFKENVLNNRVVGHRVRSYFTSLKWMFHINWIVCLIIVILIVFAQKKFRDTNVRMFCVTYISVLLLIFMVFFFNLVMYIVMHFGVNGIAKFLNTITIGAIPQSVSDFLGSRQDELTKPMFDAKSSSMRKLVLAILILLFITFILVLFEVIYIFLSLPKRLPGTTTTTTTTTTRKMRKNPNYDHEIDIAEEYRREN